MGRLTDHSPCIYVGSPWAPLGRLTDHSPCNSQWVGGGWVVWEGWVLFVWVYGIKQQPNETKPPPQNPKNHPPPTKHQQKQTRNKRFVENKQKQTRNIVENKQNKQTKGLLKTNNQRSTNYLRTFGYVPALII